MRLPWPQVKKESREPKPYERTPPNQMPGIDALDIEHVERDERRDLTTQNPRPKAPALFKNAPQIPSAPPVVSANRAKLLRRAAPRIVPK
jgi:hypothetical protein